MILRHLTGLLVLMALLIVSTSCKGYREFREARKELQIEKAERAEKHREATEAANENSADQTETEQDHFPDSLFFAMQRTPCFGRCPTYEVNIYESGYATYSGESNVDRIGEYETWVSESMADSILKKAQDIGFMMMLDSYDNSLVTDLPSTYFKLNIGGQKKEIKCRISCPERLVEFSKEVESLIDQVEWKSTSR